MLVSNFLFSSTQNNPSKGIGYTHLIDLFIPFCSNISSEKSNRFHLQRACRKCLFLVFELVSECKKEDNTPLYCTHGLFEFRLLPCLFFANFYGLSPVFLFLDEVDPAIVSAFPINPPLFHLSKDCLGHSGKGDEQLTLSVGFLLL